MKGDNSAALTCGRCRGGPCGRPVRSGGLRRRESGATTLVAPTACNVRRRRLCCRSCALTLV